MSGRRSEDFITGREQKKITEGGRGVSGRKSEDFINGESTKESQVPVGGG